LGVGEPKSLPWLPGSLAYDAAKKNFYSFDLDKAKALLAEAGVKDFEMDFLMRTSSESSALAEMYQADLAKIGVKLTIKVLEAAAWLDQVNNRKYNGMYIASGSYSQLNPSYFFNGRAGGSRVDNNSGFKDEEYNALIAKASTEPDLDKQKQLWAQVNDRFLDESFSMVLSPQPPILLTRANVRDIGFTLHSAFSFTGTWLDT
jgi:peptide/nickel transport system substrate-binding protein